MFDARNIVDYASDAALAIDGNNDIVAWNYRARNLLGYTRREVLGLHCSEVLQAVCPDGEPLCTPDCEGARCFDHFQAFNAPSCQALHKDGGWVPVNLESIVMSKRDRNSERAAIAVIFLRGKTEQRLQTQLEPILKIFTFGRFSLTAGGHGLAAVKWKRRQALFLLKFLIAHLGRAVHREVLIEHLWPDADQHQGKERLKVTVYYLRKQLREAGILEEIVETVDQSYALRQDAVWVDAVAFERSVTEGIALQRRQQWDKALKCYEEAQRLYRGDYMEEDIYSDWCAEERERLLEVHLEMLTSMAECHAALKQWAEASAVCRVALTKDPCREGIHRALMEYLLELGHNDSAIAQYHHCERILAQELGAEPLPETCQLYQKIVSGLEHPLTKRS